MSTNRRRRPPSEPARYGALPIPPAFRWYDIIKVKPKKAVTVIVVSTRPESIITHNVGGRDQPCTKRPGHDCWFPHTQTSQRYHAWLVCCQPPHRVPALIRLTNNSMFSDPRLLDPAADLRGLTIQARRIRDYDNAEMSVAILDEQPLVEDLPADVTVRKILDHMFAAPDRIKRGAAAGKLPDWSPTEKPADLGQYRDHLDAVEFLRQHTAR